LFLPGLFPMIKATAFLHSISVVSACYFISLPQADGEP